MGVSFVRLATSRRSTLAIALCAALGAGAQIPASHAGGLHSAGGNVIPVDSCADDGSVGTLRKAIEGAGDGDTIDMSALQCSLITLQSGLVSTVANLTIQGPGVDALTIDGNNAVRVLKGINLAISDLTIAHGLVSGGLGGACVQTDDDLSLDRVTLTNCVTFNVGGDAIGGAAVVLGDLTMHNASILASSVSGTGLAAGGGAVVGLTATLYDSTISGNQAQASQGHANGGGLFTLGTAAMHASTIESNTARSVNNAAYGGGIHAYAGDILVFDGSTIGGNSARSESERAYGGGTNTGLNGFATPATVSVQHSTVTGNSASSACSVCLVSGGGVHSFDSIDVKYSTFSYNEALCDDANSTCSTGGGGLAAYGQTATSSITLHNATISGNQSFGGTQPGAFSAGGGLMGSPGLRIVAHNSTIAFNNARTHGGGIAGTSSASTPSELVSTIVANNHNDAGAGDISVGPIGNSFDWLGSNSLVNAVGPGVAPPGDTSTDDPLLQPLTNNGGTTATHALGLGSPAIDHGANPDALGCDQRGAPHVRVRGAAADIGAFEFDSDPAIFTDGFDGPVTCN